MSKGPRKVDLSSIRRIQSDDPNTLILTSPNNRLLNALRLAVETKVKTVRPRFVVLEDVESHDAGSYFVQRLSLVLFDSNQGDEFRDWKMCCADKTKICDSCKTCACKMEGCNLCQDCSSCAQYCDQCSATFMLNVSYDDLKDDPDFPIQKGGARPIFTTHLKSKDTRTRTMDSIWEEQMRLKDGKREVFLPGGVKPEFYSPMALAYLHPKQHVKLRVVVTLGSGEEKTTFSPLTPASSMWAEPKILLSNDLLKRADEKSVQDIESMADVYKQVAATCPRRVFGKSPKEIDESKCNYCLACQKRFPALVRIRPKHYVISLTSLCMKKEMVWKKARQCVLETYDPRSASEKLEERLKIG